MQSYLLTNINTLNRCFACYLMILDSIAESDSFLNIALFNTNAVSLWIYLGLVLMQRMYHFHCIAKVTEN